MLYMLCCNRFMLFVLSLLGFFLPLCVSGKQVLTFVVFPNTREGVTLLPVLYLVQKVSRVKFTEGFFHTGLIYEIVHMQ